MNDDVRTPLEELFRLAASRRVHARQAAAAGVDISPPGRVLLRRIIEEGPVPLGELAVRTDMDPAATGRQVRRLEETGLVTRAVDEHDRRVTVVTATSDGRRAHRQLSAVADRHMADVLEQWSSADRTAFARHLTRFVADLRSIEYRSVAGPR